MSRLALTLDGFQASTSPKALQALLVHPASRIQTCSLLTLHLHKDGGDLVLPDHPGLVDFLWDTLPKAGSHPPVKVSHQMDRVRGTTILSHPAYQSAHKSHKGLQACLNNRGTRLECPRTPWDHRERTGPHLLAPVQTSPIADKLLLRCRQSLMCTATPHPSLR